MSTLFNEAFYEVKRNGEIATIQARGVSSIRMQTVGSVGTEALSIEGSVDGKNYLPIPESTLTGDGSIIVPVISFKSIKISCSGYTGTSYELHTIYGDLAGLSELSEPVSITLSADDIDALNEDVVLTERYAHTAFNDVEYAGFADPGSLTSDSVWRIRKFTYDANRNVLEVLFAGGTSEFVHKWDDYLTLSYS